MLTDEEMNNVERTEDDEFMSDFVSFGDEISSLRSFSDVAPSDHVDSNSASTNDVISCQDVDTK